MSLDKTTTERAILYQSPLWMAAVGWVMLTGRLGHWGDAELLVFSSAVSVPSVIFPAYMVRRDCPSTRKQPLHQRYWLKLNLWVFVVVCWGTYFGTHYFFNLMGMRYRFANTRLTLDSPVLGAANNGQTVPLFMYPLTHAYFMTYFVVMLRAERLVRDRVLPRSLRRTVVGKGLVVLVVSYSTAYLETFFMAADVLSEYFYYLDRARMLRLGSLGYAMYFVAGLPMVKRIDADGGRWDLGKTMVEAAATCMAIQQIGPLVGDALVPAQLVPPQRDVPGETGMRHSHEGAGAEHDEEVHQGLLVEGEAVDDGLVGQQIVLGHDGDVPSPVRAGPVDAAAVDVDTPGELPPEQFHHRHVAGRDVDDVEVGEPRQVLELLLELVLHVGESPAVLGGPGLDRVLLQPQVRPVVGVRIDGPAGVDREAELVSHLQQDLGGQVAGLVAEGQDLAVFVGEIRPVVPHWILEEGLVDLDVHGLLAADANPLTIEPAVKGAAPLARVPDALGRMVRLELITDQRQVLGEPVAVVRELILGVVDGHAWTRGSEVLDKGVAVKQVLQGRLVDGLDVADVLWVPLGHGRDHDGCAGVHRISYALKDLVPHHADAAVLPLTGEQQAVSEAAVASACLLDGRVVDRRGELDGGGLGYKVGVRRPSTVGVQDEQKPKQGWVRVVKQRPAPDDNEWKGEAESHPWTLWKHAAAAAAAAAVFSDGFTTILHQDVKVEIVPQRHSVLGLSVRPRPLLGGPRVAPPLVPGDELLARPDDRHFHAADAPRVLDVLLGPLQDRLAQAAALPLRVDGEEAKVGDLARVVAAHHLAAGHRLVRAGREGHQHGAQRRVDLGEEPRRVDALAGHQVGLRGPSLAARLAAVCVLYEWLQRWEVAWGRFAYVQ
ncbi:uncharacterized protein PpBr36_10875 [Pyricularia pennisetigena]|uniref:uncharacterized protein n=1 Tax=Pyricularia pennisetigena TaxID=1578925 RepID=UPI00114EC811|nr:uncharacterized protein PpBr36_10875 [Pyricularia pennisetigena]TLS20859.1 hypothetical protein PpBr36_10875 [Pyricularia pennisetigena]